MKPKLFICSVIVSLVWIGGFQTWSMGQGLPGNAVTPRNNAEASSRVKPSSGAIADLSALKRQSRKKSLSQPGAGDLKAGTPATSLEVTPVPTSAEVAAQEQHVKELLDKVSRLIDEVNYAEAARTIQAADGLVLYNPQIYALRGGLLGVYRNYEDAVKIYNRILEDQTLDAMQRAKMTDLRNYCAEHAIASPAERAGDNHCHFCKAKLLPKAAYCHVCLSFQHKFASLKAGRGITSFAYDETGLRGVSYNYRNTHDAGNIFRSLMAGAASAGGSTTPVEIRDEERIDRMFTFDYDHKAPQSVEFKSNATVGGSTISVVQSVGGVATTTKQSRNEATAQAFELNDRLVYANHPQIDAAFALKAFGQNIYRGFAGIWNFSPFWWVEPHIFVLYYDKDGRISRAVDSYHYGKVNAAGHSVVTGRKRFIGPNRIDPLSDSNVYSFTYNDDGLIASITLTSDGQESYRREIIYGPQGILEELEFFPKSKKPRVTKYSWKGEKLVSAKHGGNGWTEVKAFFQ